MSSLGGRAGRRVGNGDLSLVVVGLSVETRRCIVLNGEKGKYRDIRKRYNRRTNIQRIMFPKLPKEEIVLDKPVVVESNMLEVTFPMRQQHH